MPKNVDFKIQGSVEVDTTQAGAQLDMLQQKVASSSANGSIPTQTKEIKAMQAAVVRLTDAEKNANKAFMNNVAAGKLSITTIDREVKSIKQMAAANRALAQRLSKTSKIVAIFEGALGPHAGRLSAAATAVRQFGVSTLLMGGAFGVVVKAFGKAIPAALELQSTMAMLSATTDDASVAFKIVFKEAQRTGQAFMPLTRSFAQISAAAKGTTLEGAGVVKLFKAMNTAALALRLDVHQTAGAMKALEQMLSKGTVSSEELRGQLGERLPGAFKLASSAMGYSTSEMYKQVAAGKVLAEDLLPKLAVAMEATYGASAQKSANTLGVALGRLKTTFDHFMATLASPELLNAFSAGINGITASIMFLQTHLDTLQTIAKLIVALTVAYGGLKVILFANKLFREQRIVVALATASLGTHTKGTKALTVASVLMSSVIQKLSGVMLILNRVIGANPYVRFAIIVTAVAAALGVMNAMAQDSVKVGQALNDDIDARAKKLNDLNNLQLKANKQHIDSINAKIAKMKWAYAFESKARQDEITANIQQGKDNLGIYKQANELLRSQKLANYALAKADAAKASMEALQARIDSTQKELQLEKDSGWALFKAMWSGSNNHDKLKADRELMSTKATIYTTAMKDYKALTDKNAADLAAAQGKAGEDELLIQTKMADRLIALKKIQAVNNLKITKAQITATNAVQGTDDALNKTRIVARLKAENAYISSRYKAKSLEELTTLRALNTSKKSLLDAQYNAEDKLRSKAATLAGNNAKRSAQESINAARFAAHEINLVQKRQLDHAAKLAQINADRIAANAANTNSDSGLAGSIKAKFDALAAAENSSYEHTVAFEASKIALANNSTALLLKLQTISGKDVADNDVAQSMNKLRLENETFAATKAAREASLRIQVEAAKGNTDEIAALKAAARDAELVAITAHNDKVVSLKKAGTDKLKTALDTHNTEISGMSAVFSKQQQDLQGSDAQTLLTGFQGMSDNLKNIKQIGVNEQLALDAGQVDNATALHTEGNKAKMDIALAGTAALSGLMKSHNRKQFELGKAAAVANTIINGIQAITVGYSQLGPYAGTAFAIIMAATTAMNVQKIMATKMGGGASSGSATPSVGAANPTTGFPQRAVAFNPTRTQSPTTPFINITQNITAPNATAGTAQAIQTAANLGAQQAVNTIAIDFATNGALRQTLAV